MEKIIEALHTIKDECKKNTNCSKCPLGTTGGACKIVRNDPEDWEINDIPRALM